MAEYNSVAIVNDLSKGLEDDINSLIDRMAECMKQVIRASKDVEPAYPQDLRYDSLRAHASPLCDDFVAPSRVETLDGKIDVDATVRKAAENLFYAYD